MSDYFTEQSESDAVTTYRLLGRVYEGRTAAGVDTLIADSTEYGRMLFLDGELQSASADEVIYHESLVHPVMAGVEMGDAPIRVLVVGGGEGATVREVLKWPNVVVDWVDYDQDLVNLCREHLRWAPTVYNHDHVCYIPGDIQVVLRILGSYHVIILDLPDPDGDTGYLYSDEFWSDMRAHLRRGGRLVTHCGPVRPFRGIGGGFQRVSAAFGGSGIAGFYNVGIPSFQGDWGFWMITKDGSDPFAFLYNQTEPLSLPQGLQVVDRLQLKAWANPSKRWMLAINGLI